MAPVMAVLVIFSLLAKDSPRQGTLPKWKEYAAVLREGDTAWFCLFYSFTFGGFVGFASFLTVFFHDQYFVSKVRSGDFTTLVVLAGSFLRPVGGWLSDKIGGYRLLLVLLAGVAMCLAGVGQLPPLPVVIVLLFVTMAMLGMGNGAVFQLVPQRFAGRVGVVTGLVGGRRRGRVLFAILAGRAQTADGAVLGWIADVRRGIFLAAFILLQLGTRWRSSWEEASVGRAGIFSYRDLVRNLAEETTD